MNDMRRQELEKSTRGEAPSFFCLLTFTGEGVAVYGERGVKGEKWDS